MSNGDTARHVRFLAQQVRRVMVLVIGGLVVLAGIVMLVTPGPGLLTIAAGLGILSFDYPWARELLAKARARIAAGQARRRETGRKDV